MRKKTSTKITFETERQILISQWQSLFALCEACGDEVALVTVNEAAATAGVSSLTVYRMAEAGKLHYAETGVGELLVCTVSLDDLISNQPSHSYHQFSKRRET
jgi:excisionase family DNA binding protein